VNCSVKTSSGLASVPVQEIAPLAVVIHEEGLAREGWTKRNANDPRNKTASLRIEDPFSSQEGYRRRDALGLVKLLLPYISRRNGKLAHAWENIFWMDRAAELADFSSRHPMGTFAGRLPKERWESP
jgi:hypothetical protein